ncbi:MAG TPA: tyrosine-type recombinase/integrase [Terriglobia bacterium]|nr:tyrosine-type recombinase/integrase [Terriglobia bacterium]
MDVLEWARFPAVEGCRTGRAWLRIQGNLGLAKNTLQAYGRSLHEYLLFCAQHGVDAESATREQVSGFVRSLLEKEGRPHKGNSETDVQPRLANATVQLRLTAIRLFYDYLIEEGIRPTNPVGRGRYTPGKSFGAERGLVPRYRKLPWIPNDDEWTAVLKAAREEPLRNRVMLAFSYDAALRREELCMLETGDIDPAHRLLHIRAETTKNRQDRVVPYSPASGTLYAAYLVRRNELSRDRGPLFLSESRRNLARPLSIWTWSKVVTRMAERSGLPGLTTHTARHLRLTDLARAGWDVHEIAAFAGHRCIQTTLCYIHSSGRELAKKLEHGMAEIHAWRARMFVEMLQ